MRRLLLPRTASFAANVSRWLPLKAASTGLVLFHTTTVQAEPNYEAIVAKFVNRPEGSVPCGSCHDPPGLGGETRNQLFYESLEDNGLIAGVLTSLQPALEQLAAAKVDSDGDSFGDIVELTAGTSPNDGNSTPEPNNTGGGGASGGGAGRAGGGGLAAGGAGGRAGAPTSPNGGSGSTPSSGSGGSENDDGSGTLAPGSTVKSCSYAGGDRADSLSGVTLLAVAWLARRRSGMARVLKALRTLGRR